MGDYLRPRVLEEALRALAAGPWLVLAGGTDVFPAHVTRPLEAAVLDLSALEALRGIAEADGHWRIGARTTWTDVIRAPLPPVFDGLKLAAREIGGVQIQNAATLAGNLCNAAPAADGVPCLLALDAAVELASLRGRRVLPVADFITGARHTVRRADEILTAILVPRPRGARAVADFRKLGARRYQVISIVMVALVVEVDEDGAIGRAGVAVGACSPVARRLPALEGALVGRSLGQPIEDAVRADHLAPLAPIDDIRASADYRLDAVLTLIRRGLGALGKAA